MNECCNFETKKTMNKVPYASFDAIYFALFLNKKESVVCNWFTGELVLERKNSLSGHIVSKFLDCVQMGLPPTLGQIAGRQMDGERMPLWKRTALFPVNDILLAMGKKNAISFASRGKFFLVSGFFLLLVILSFVPIWTLITTNKLGALFVLVAIIVGVCSLPFTLYTSNKHYKPACDCSMDELIAYIASLDPNSYDANSPSVDLIRQARRVLALSDPNTFERIEVLNNTIDEKKLEIAKLQEITEDQKAKNTEQEVVIARLKETVKTLEINQKKDKEEKDELTAKNVEFEKQLQKQQEKILEGLSAAFEAEHGFGLAEIMRKEMPKNPELYFIYIDLFWLKVCRKLGECYRSYSKSQSGPTLPEFVSFVGEEIWEQTDFIVKEDEKRDSERFQHSLQIQAIEYLRKHERVGRCEQRRLNPIHVLELLDLIEENSCFEMKETRRKIRVNFKGR